LYSIEGLANMMDHHLILLKNIFFSL